MQVPPSQPKPGLQALHALPEMPHAEAVGGLVQSPLASQQPTAQLSAVH
jgi:hypothetical protein